MSLEKAINLKLRFDIQIKRLYVRSYLSGQVDPIIEKLYRKHIFIINGGFENDKSNKTGSKEFIENFRLLIESIITKGLSLNEILVDNDLVPIDGAHRIAIALELGLNIKILKQKNISAPRYSFDFFKQYGLSESILGSVFMSTLPPNLKGCCIVLWPASKEKHNMIQESLQHEIILDYSIQIQDNYGFNIIKKLYWQEPWLGSYLNGFKGIRSKQFNVKAFRGKVIRILLVGEEYGKTWKAMFRKTFELGQHGLHSSDSNLEFKHMVESFSYHELRRLSVAKMNVFDIDFIKLVKKNHHRLKENEIIVGGLNALYGLRKSLDIDICTKNCLEKRCESITEEHIRTSNTTYGFKFTSPENYIKLKKQKNKGLDKYDIAVLQGDISLIEYRLYYLLRVLYRYTKSLIVRYS